MKNLYLILLVLFCISNTYAQIGIKANNSAPIPSAQLEVQSTTKAFYPPRMTTSQRTNMPNPPLAGAMVFDTDLNGLFTFNGSSWVSGSGLTLPFTGSQSINGLSLFNVTNTNTSNFIPVMSASTNSNSSGVAVSGIAVTENPIGNSIGVRGFNASINNFGSGVEGVHDGGGAGVNGRSETGSGIRGISLNGIGGSFSSPNGGYALITNVGNVGIGIPAPLEKLHVSGNIRVSSLAGTGVRDVKADANGNLTLAVRTKYYSAPSLSFVQENTNGSSVANHASGAAWASTASGTLKCPLFLPHRANITNARIYYSDNDATNDLTFSVQRTFLPNSGGFYGTTPSSSGSSATVLFVDIPLSFTVDNEDNTYFINVNPKTGGSVWINSVNLSVRSVVITYTE